ncbi:MAG: chemotaxis protein CheZ [Candidatus Kryptoniota bacterium]
MNSNNLDGILDKINELRALFIFGQRVIPFLEELFYFVHDIVPVLEEINTSIYESANKMPHASSQLTNVTKATELATTEILDNLDSVLSRLNAIDAHFKTAATDLAALDKLEKQSIKILRTSLNGERKDLFQTLLDLHQQKEAHLKAVVSNAGGLEQSLKDIRAKSNDIMISLQVQDITSQQIASVNHLIGSVQQRLSGLIDRFKLSGTELITEIKKAEDHAFNPDATYDRSGQKQKTADEIVGELSSLKNKITGVVDKLSDPASQDEIDKLFIKGSRRK